MNEQGKEVLLEEKIKPALKVAFSIPIVIVCIIFGSIGLFNLKTSAQTIFSRAALMVSGVRAQGTVVKNTENQKVNGQTTLGHTIIEFSTADSQPIRFTEERVFKSPHFKNGQLVQVIYSKSAPQHAMVDNGPSSLIYATIFALLNVFILIVVFLKLRSLFQKQPPKQSNTKATPNEENENGIE
jgi:hypothetical protein